MPPSKSSRRPTTGAPGVKMLLTAASVAATIGGWAALSNTQKTASSSATPIPAPAQSANLLSIKLAPLPTLVPPPDPKSIDINAQAVVAPSSNRPAAAAAAPAPAPAAPQIAGLRVVNAPTGGGGVAGAPSPATTTRSSKP